MGKSYKDDCPSGKTQCQVAMALCKTRPMTITLTVAVRSRTCRRSQTIQLLVRELFNAQLVPDSDITVMWNFHSFYWEL